MKRVCYLALTVLALDGWCSSLASDQAWLETAGQTAITAAARTMANGTVVYVPQGSCKYEAFWLRDYVMMLEGKLVPQDKILDCAKVFFNAVSSEGYGVDCVKFDGTPIYKPGYGTMGTNPVLDGGPYTVKLAYESYQATKDPYFISAETLTLLGKVLAAIPHQSGGILPWINPAITHDRCPFGFTDTVRKQGECLFSSLLELEARRNYAALLTAAGQTTAAAQELATVTAMATAIETTFWDDQLGLYRAATVKCREADIWGSAFAVWLGVASSSHADRVAQYFEDNFAALTQHGQIRHLPASCYWEESSAAQDTYQNGGYWGTASGWFAWTLARRNRPKALALLHELVADYQARGINEWVFGNRVECAQYLSSAALPLQAMRRLGIFWR